jgi:hypothetical protein
VATDNPGATTKADPGAATGAAVVTSEHPLTVGR